MTRIEKALEMFNKGFTSKASQKRCLEEVSRAYSDIREKITHTILSLRDNGQMGLALSNELYWLLPYELHQFRPKHAEALETLFPEPIKEIEYLVELREQIKSVPIVKVETATNEKVERIEKSLKEIFEARVASYERGLFIAELFHGLPVSVSPHWVNREGTQFIRYFYYLAGKLTALNTIMAVAETFEANKEKEGK